MVLLEMEPPTNVGDVQSLLGMTNFLARFIPNYSTATAHLRKLTCNEQKFRWEHEKHSSLEMLKTVLGRTPVVVYFYVEKDIAIIVDASLVGLYVMLLEFCFKKP